MKVNSFHIKIISAIVFYFVSFPAFTQSSVLQLQKELVKNISAAKKADVCFTLSIWYADKLKIDSALFYANQIKEFSTVGGYAAGLGKFYLASAAILRYRQRNEEARVNALKAIQIFAGNKEILMLGRSYWELATTMFVLKNVIASRQNYWTAISYLSLAKDNSGSFRAYYWLARTYHKSAESDSAAFYYLKALEMAEGLKDDMRIHQTACEAGECYLGQGDLEKANKYLSYGLKKRTASSDKVNIRAHLENYITTLILLHDFNRVDSAIREFELMNVKLNDAWGKIALNRIKGLFEFEQKNYEKALSYLHKANAGIGEQKVSNKDIKVILLLLGKAEYETHDYNNAIRHLEMAAKKANELRFVSDEMEANLLLSKAFEKKGSSDSALYYFRNYSFLKDSLLSVQKQKNIIEFTTRYETGKKEQEIRLLQKEGEANTYLIRLKNEQLLKQQLEDEQKSQQLALLSQQNEIRRLEASQKTLAFENQQKEISKNQHKLKLLAKENELQVLVATKEEQRKNFAYLAIAAILFLSANVFYRYIQNKRLSRKLSTSLVDLKQAQEQLIKSEREKESENIRSDISRDIHDEVGATLSGVALFSEIARQKIEQHQENDAQIYLDHITANSKEMIEKMSDIVWTVNPLNDSFERIIAKLQSYAVNLCAGKGIRLHFDIEDAVRLYSPSMQVKKNIYMLMKEAINNAVKYSGGNNIYLSLHKKADQIMVEIIDDGKGFDNTKSYDGNGLNNMYKRAADLHADIAIDSVEGKGTHIRLQFNFHPAGGQFESV